MVELGEYRHYKGGKYRVLGTAIMEHDRSKEYVLYKAITTTEEDKDKYYLRTEEDFLSAVEVPLERFTKIGA